MIFYLIFLYIGSIVGKLIFFSINRSDFELIFRKYSTSNLLTYLTLPFAALSLLYTIRRLELNDFRESKTIYIQKLSLLAEILSGIVFFFLGIYFSTALTASLSSFEILITIAFQIFVVVALLYLAIYDLLTFSISIKTSKTILFVVILANIVIALLRFLLPDSTLTDNIHLGYADNLFSGVGIGLIMWLIVKITKEKGMGEGDIDIMLIVGLVLGWPGVLISYLATLISGSSISLIYAGIIKKFRGVIVPFVPFIVIGYAIALAFGFQLSRYFIFF